MKSWIILFTYLNNWGIACINANINTRKRNHSMNIIKAGRNFWTVKYKFLIFEVLVILTFFVLSSTAGCCVTFSISIALVIIPGRGYFYSCKVMPGWILDWNRVPSLYTELFYPTSDSIYTQFKFDSVLLTREVLFVNFVSNLL